MRHFLIEVWPGRTEVKEFVNPLGQIHSERLVDGETYLYSIIANAMIHPKDKLWKERANIQIDHHALSGCTSIGHMDFWPNKRIGDIITTEKTDLWREY